MIHRSCRAFLINWATGVCVCACSCVRACGSFIVSLCFFYRPQFSLLFLFTLIVVWDMCSKWICCGSAGATTLARGTPARPTDHTATHLFRPHPTNIQPTTSNSIRAPPPPPSPPPTTKLNIQPLRWARTPFRCRFYL